MSSFDSAISVILRHEGGFVNNSSDPGGATNYGISLRFLTHLVDQDHELLSQVDLNKGNSVDVYDIQYMYKNTAIDLYRTEWWERYGYGNINDQMLATKVFDLAVNIGPSKTGRLLQQACVELSGIPNLLKIDGALGPRTLGYVNSLTNEQTQKLLVIFSNKATVYYQQLAAKNPVLRQFLAGWLKRLHDTHGLQLQA